MKQLLYALFFAGLVLFAVPQPVLAQTANTTKQCADLQARFENAGAGNLANQLPHYCTDQSIYNKVVKVLYGLIGGFAVIALIYGGYRYMLAGGNEVQAKQGRAIIQWTIIGFIVVVVAALIINVIVKTLIDNKLF